VKFLAENNIKVNDIQVKNLLEQGSLVHKEDWLYLIIQSQKIFGSSGVDEFIRSDMNQLFIQIFDKSDRDRKKHLTLD